MAAFLLLLVIYIIYDMFLTIYSLQISERREKIVGIEFFVYGLILKWFKFLKRSQLEFFFHFIGFTLDHVKNVFNQFC